MGIINRQRSLGLTISGTLLLGLTGFVLLVGNPAPARGNCAAPTGYAIDSLGSTVYIQPDSYDERSCPDAEGLLRENVDTGEVVRVGDFCAQAPVEVDLRAYNATEHPYVDECVPPGTYRYGFAAPFECCSYCCGTAYFVEHTVETWDGTCRLRDGNPGTTAASEVPWGSDPNICSYQGGGDGGLSGNSNTSTEKPVGCSSSGTDLCSSLLTIQLLVALFGLLILWRRRRPQTADRQL